MYFSFTRSFYEQLFQLNLFKINNKPEIYFNENGLVVNVYGDKLLDYTSK